VFKTGRHRQSVKISSIFVFGLTIICHINAQAETLIDPTMPPDAQYRQQRAGTKAAPEWVLTSTIIASARRLATINGKTVSVGDRVGGARVIRIEPTQVALRQNHRDIVVALSPRDFKRNVRK